MGERKNEPIGTLDFETDPFRAGRVPHPFAACIYFGRNDFSLLWESDSSGDFITRVIRALRRMPPCTLYAHNGGRFDFHYLLESATDTIEVRNGRVIKMHIGNVTLKDSFPLMPFALEEFRKTKINYDLFERHRRESHREAITNYLIDDCADLLELVVGFRSIVGERDTIGSAAFLQMRELGLKIEHMTESHDEMFRPFYFGGRVEAFERGVLNGPFYYYDINSAYPFAMREKHAHGGSYTHAKKLPRNYDNCFIRLRASSAGALPVRTDDGKLSFPHGTNEFHATGWEVRAGLETRTLHIDEILDVWIPDSFICFREYVDKFFAMRADAKRRDDKIGSLAYKYLLNSGYGKFAQNPREFKEYKLAPIGRNVAGWDWETDFGAISLWSRPSYRGWGFFDVCTGASITGYQRANLWRGACKARGLAYMDTDALICKGARLPFGDKLGQWKTEGIARRVAIAGKKLYGVEWDFYTMKREGIKLPEERYKIASKGARLSWNELLEVCNGETVVWENIAPTFSIAGAHFIRREIRAT